MYRTKEKKAKKSGSHLLGFLNKGAQPLSASQKGLINILFGVTLAGAVIGLFLIVALFIFAFIGKHLGSNTYDWLLGIFSDFSFIMNASLSEDPYLIDGSSYPPTAILILLPFAYICRDILALYPANEMPLDEFNARLLTHGIFWFALFLFFVICSVILLFALVKKYRFDASVSLKLSATILLSAPIIFTVMRGNTIILAAALTFLFLLLKDNDNPYLREISLICLAIAGAIKIYPLFFGVYLLTKKKLFASFRVAVYFFLTVIASFFLLNGGLGAIEGFLQNLGGFASNELRLVAHNNLSINSIIYRAVYIFSPDAANSSAADIASTVISACVFLFSTICAIATKRDLSRAVIVSAAIILVPSVSYFYVLIFTLPALMEFIRTFPSMKSGERKLYTVLFAFLFFLPFQMPQVYILHSVALIIMLAFETRKVLKDELIPVLHQKC